MPDPSIQRPGDGADILACHWQHRRATARKLAHCRSTRGFNHYLAGATFRISRKRKGFDWKTFAVLGRKSYANQQGGRGGTGRRKGLKIPRWQRRVGSSPTARTTLRPDAVGVARRRRTGRGWEG